MKEGTEGLWKVYTTVVLKGHRSSIWWYSPPASNLGEQMQDKQQWTSYVFLFTNDDAPAYWHYAAQDFRSDPLTRLVQQSEEATDGRWVQWENREGVGWWNYVVWDSSRIRQRKPWLYLWCLKSKAGENTRKWRYRTDFVEHVDTHENHSFFSARVQTPDYLKLL